VGPDGYPAGLVALRDHPMTPVRSLGPLALFLGLLAAGNGSARAQDRSSLSPAPDTTRASAAMRTDEDGPVRLSLPTESDRAAWRKPGFRLQLGASFGDLQGLGGAPSGLVYGALLRIGMRLDERWSILGSFQYAGASGASGLSGLRFLGTLEPTWHVLPNVSLAVGLGFGGIVESRTNRADPEPLRDTLDTSYTFVDASHPLARCSGVGVAALTRADYMFVIGPRASTGLALEVSGQWTGCVDSGERVEPDTGRPIVRRQWWPHLGGTIAWVIAWR